MWSSNFKYNIYFVCFYNKKSNISEFINYIKKRKKQCSVNQESWKLISDDEILNQLYNNDSLELALLAFKYTMSQEKNKINNFIFIMDDLESVGQKEEILSIYLANKIEACLENRDELEKDKWCCTVIIACRHYVFRILNTKWNNGDDNNLLQKAGIDKSTMESFSVDEFDMGDGPSISEIIDKRKETIIKDMDKDDKEGFNEICLMLHEIVNQVGDLLLGLCCNDYRKTFKRLKKIIYNKHWLQRVDSINGAFKIRTVKENFFNNKANIVRALALGEDEIYNNDESIVPNLLANRQDGGDLWVLLTLNFVLRNNGEANWKRSINLEKVKEDVRGIFTDNNLYFQEFEYALEFLILNRILLRGRVEEQRDSVDLSEIDLSNVKFVYPSNAAKILWDSLAENSIWFELFIDDIWIENSFRKEMDSVKKYRQFNLINFIECINYLEYLLNVEYKLRLYLKNRGNIKRYYDKFASKAILCQLLKGLNKSFNAYFQSKIKGDMIADSLFYKLNLVADKINRL